MPNPYRQFVVEVDGSNTGRGHALSRQFSFPIDSLPCNTILPSHCLIAGVKLDIEAKVKQALTQDSGLSNASPNRLFFPLCLHLQVLECCSLQLNVLPNHLFVPICLRLQVLEWGYKSNLACHPGIARTHFILQQCFWWPTLERDVSLWQPATSASAVNTTTGPRLASSDTYPCLTIPGHISHWIS